MTPKQKKRAINRGKIYCLSLEHPLSILSDRAVIVIRGGVGQPVADASGGLAVGTRKFKGIP